MLSHYCSIEAWKRPGEVAEEKFILLKSWTVESNLDDHIKTDEVFAVPDPPINKTPFWTKDVDEWIGLGWFKTEFVIYSVLHESSVGINNCENFKPFVGSGFHFYGVIILY